MKETAAVANCGPWQVATVVVAMAATHALVLAFEHRPVLPRFSVVSAVSEVSAAGMGPSSSPALPLRFSVVSAVSSPSTSGRTPVRLLLLRSSPVTRPLVRVTPCQWLGGVMFWRNSIGNVPLSPMNCVAGAFRLTLLPMLPMLPMSHGPKRT